MRNKKLWKRLTALAMAGTMLLAISGCGSKDAEPTGEVSKQQERSESTKTQTDEKEENKEEVEVTIWAQTWNPVQGIGPQYNPIADKIAEETGVRMSVFQADVSGEAEQLATMRAANDLPDIFYVPDAATMEELIEAGQILELSQYWDAEKLPNLASENGVSYGVQNFVTDNKFDGKRYSVVLWSGTGAEDQPTTGFYVPWEVYKAAGYPEVNSLDDLVDALAKMNEVYSENADGQKVFGTGAWFADDGGWGSWCVDGISGALGDRLNGYLMACDTVTNEISEKCPILDPDSSYWQGVKFWYNMNQRGLVDPDSITQKTDQWQEKAYSGRYILVMPSWETANMRNGTNMSWIALKPFTKAVILDWSAETTGSMYAISSTCKNPEAALKLLDYLCSPEGCRVAYSGIEGSAWEMVDGKAQYTEQYKADAATLTEVEKAKKYGETPGHFVGFALNVISPVDNSTYDLTYTPEYRAANFTEAEQDAFEHYGVNSLREIYTKDTLNSVTRMSEYTNNMPALPDELQKNETDLSNFVIRNYLSCVFAKNDAEFEAQKQAIIDGAAEYNAEALFQWYKDEYAKAKEKVDPYLP